MRLRTLFAAAAATAITLVAAAPVLAQAPADPLPDAPGKDVVERVCTACHDVSQFASARLTPQGWDDVISQMQSLGASMSADDQSAIAAYLSKNLGASAPATSPTPSEGTSPSTPAAPPAPATQPPQP
ncbi:MAG: hypothetical protein KGO51_01615 [Alphaproteobacteria bacterium]|nr:hypothetical protein [Alphaproteobacteria bacterium]